MFAYFGRNEEFMPNLNGIPCYRDKMVLYPISELRGEQEVKTWTKSFKKAEDHGYTLMPVYPGKSFERVLVNVRTGEVSSITPSPAKPEKARKNEPSQPTQPIVRPRVSRGSEPIPFELSTIGIPLMVAVVILIFGVALLGRNETPTTKSGTELPASSQEASQPVVVVHPPTPAPTALPTTQLVSGDNLLTDLECRSNGQKVTFTVQIGLAEKGVHSATFIIGSIVTEAKKVPPGQPLYQDIVAGDEKDPHPCQIILTSDGNSVSYRMAD